MSTENPLKVLGVSCIRADYDLLSGIYRRLNKMQDVDFRLMIGGAHLSSSFGDSLQEIHADELPILTSIESLIDSDMPSARVKTAAVFMQSAIDAISTYQPNVVIYAGDREDAFVTAMICAYLKVPTIHFFGGQHARDGNVDNPVRHAISKLSTFHFVSHQRHRERLLCLGEHSKRIFVIGSPAIDKFQTEPWLSKEEVIGYFGTTQEKSSQRNYAVLIYHPVLHEEQTAASEARTILQALSKFDLHTFISSPNTDAGARQVLQVYEEYEKSEAFTFYQNAPRNIFINLLRHAKFLIGNSSLGLLEAPSIPLPAINVGSRQKGRLAERNVIFVSANAEEINDAIQKALSPEFADVLSDVNNPYGDGHSVERAVERIMSLDYEKWLPKWHDPLDLGTDL